MTRRLTALSSTIRATGCREVRGRDIEDVAVVKSMGTMIFGNEAGGGEEVEVWSSDMTSCAYGSVFSSAGS